MQQFCCPGYKSSIDPSDFPLAFHTEIRGEHGSGDRLWNSVRVILETECVAVRSRLSSWMHPPHRCRRKGRTSCKKWRRRRRRRRRCRLRCDRCACMWWGCGGEESRFGPSWRLTPHSDSWPATSLRAGSASLVCFRCPYTIHTYRSFCTCCASSPSSIVYVPAEFRHLHLHVAR